MTKAQFRKLFPEARYQGTTQTFFVAEKNLQHAKNVAQRIVHLSKRITQVEVFFNVAPLGIS